MPAKVACRFSARPFVISLISGLLIVLTAPATAQIVSTWSGGAGNWSDCPPSGNARWNTCPDPPKGKGWPNGNFDAVINGGPVTATSASVVNLTIDSGGSLVFAPNQPGIVDITGSSIVNNGSISLAGSDGLQIEGNTTVTLSGSGSVTLAGNNFTGANGSPTLISQQAIGGYGNIGGLVIKNQKTISASGGTMNIQPSSGGLFNTGLIEAQSGAQLNLISGPFNNAGGTITALNGSTILLQANISGGTITTAGTGHFTLAPPGAGAGLSGLTNGGTFSIPAGANLNVQGTITNTGVFDLDGSIDANGPGSVTFQGIGSVLMNGGQFGSVSAAPMVNKQLIHGGGTFFQVPLTNTSTIQADNTSTQLAINGGVTTNQGHLQASGGGTLFLGTVVNNSGGTIEAFQGSTVILSNNSNGSVNGGTLITNGTGVVQSQNGVLDGTVNVPTNAGILDVDNFDLFIKGKVNNTGVISLIGNSCIILNKPSTLVGSGRVNMASTTCIFGSGLSFTNNSTIQGSGSIGDSNPMPIFNGGTIFANQKTPLLIVPNASGFTNMSAGKLQVSAGSTLHINGLFNDLPATGLLGSGIYNLGGVMEVQNTVVTNAANITLTGAGAEILSDNTGSNGLRTLTGNAAAGVLTLQGGQSLSTATSLTNSGKLTVAAGSTLKLAGKYTQSAGTTLVDGALAAPTGLAVNGGSFSGAGAVAAAVTSSATVIVGDSTTKAGKLSVAGAYTQNAAGVLDIAIRGTTPATQYSQLAVSNGASLNGTLNINRSSAFLPAINEVFTILTASVITGKFATVNGLSINSGEHFEINYSGTQVTLKVISGP